MAEDAELAEAYLDYIHAVCNCPEGKHRNRLRRCPRTLAKRRLEGIVMS